MQRSHASYQCIISHGLMLEVFLIFANILLASRAHVPSTDTFFIAHVPSTYSAYVPRIRTCTCWCSFPCSCSFHQRIRAHLCSTAFSRTNWLTSGLTHLNCCYRSLWTLMKLVSNKEKSKTPNAEQILHICFSRLCASFPVRIVTPALPSVYYFPRLLTK